MVTLDAPTPRPTKKKKKKKNFCLKSLMNSVLHTSGKFSIQFIKCEFASELTTI